MSGLVGIWGHPYLDLSRVIDTTELPALHEEICWGLGQVETEYTGGSLRWMGVAAPWVMDDGHADYGFVIEQLSDADWLRFVSLAEAEEPSAGAGGLASGDTAGFPKAGGLACGDTAGFDLARRAEYRFGDETDHPLTPRQVRWLEYRFGVYFPWQVVYHLVENFRWEDNHSGAGKGFGEEACRVFPRTVEFIRRLPFAEIGRCLIFGLRAGQHATLHRDSEPGSSLGVAQSITLSPGGNKRFYLYDEAADAKVPVTAPLYWFNDMDWHGVEADPFFRYSIRVDGVFRPEFARELRRRFGR